MKENFSLERSNAPEDKPAELIGLDEDQWGTYFMSSRDLCALDCDSGPSKRKAFQL